MAQLDDAGGQPLSEPAALPMPSAKPRQGASKAPDGAKKQRVYDGAQRALITQPGNAWDEHAPSWSAGRRPSSSWPNQLHEQELQRVQIEARRTRLADQRAELDCDETVAQRESSDDRG